MITGIADLRACLLTGRDATGYRSYFDQSVGRTICAIPSGTSLEIAQELQVLVPNVTLKGAIVTRRDEVKLSRSSPACPPRLIVVGHLAPNFVLQDITIEGNRERLDPHTQQTVGCKIDNSQDVQIQEAPAVTIEGDFLNAPNYGLQLKLDCPKENTACTSSIVNSLFDNARVSGAMIKGNVKAIGNVFRNVGTGGIDVRGRGAQVRNNLFLGNHDECEVFNSPGGQVFIPQDTSEATVSGNYIDGRRLNGQMPCGDIAGIEAYGVGHKLYNNGIVHHQGAGISAAALHNVDIRGDNPDAPHPDEYLQPISNNQFGIAISTFGYPDSQDPRDLYSSQIRIEKIRAVQNREYGITLQQQGGNVGSITDVSVRNSDLCQNGIRGFRALGTEISVSTANNIQSSSQIRACARSTEVL